MAKKFIDIYIAFLSAYHAFVREIRKNVVNPIKTNKETALQIFA